jgi:23S rRNA (adenine2030-N6)-methyltransferase
LVRVNIRVIQSIMNYRHSFHAGNHTEVFKHSALCLLLAEFLKKPTPFAALDTHAGAGSYDLTSPEAKKTAEAQQGIGIIFGKEIPHAATYLSLVGSCNPTGLKRYPGSPRLVQAMLRANDRLIACELREDDAAHLRAEFKGDRRILVHRRDGYEATGAFVPLATKRGLVFVDPPFERQDEFETLGRALNAGVAKWLTGVFVAWYPLKNRSGVRRLRKLYSVNNPPTLCCEFLREPIDGTTLAGSGLLICNPPWQVDEKLSNLCRELASAFDTSKATWSLEWWINERD